jgi:hypothetical protein
VHKIGPLIFAVAIRHYEYGVWLHIMLYMSKILKHNQTQLVCENTKMQQQIEPEDYGHHIALFVAFDSDMKQTFKHLLHEDKFQGFCVDQGWWPIVNRVFMLLATYVAKQNDSGGQLRIISVKDKMGKLSIKYTGLQNDPYVQGVLNMAAEWSAQVCYHCGKPGQLRASRKWIKTLCDAHELDVGSFMLQ